MARPITLPKRKTIANHTKSPLSVSSISKTFKGYMRVHWALMYPNPGLSVVFKRRHGLMVT